MAGDVYTNKEKATMNSSRQLMLTIWVKFTDFRAEEGDGQKKGVPHESTKKNAIMD